MRLFEAIMERNPKNCSLAFCSPASSCVDVHNNISESFNNAIDSTRYMPVVEMLKTIRRTCMVCIVLRKKKAYENTGRFPSMLAKIIEEEQKMLKFCKMIPRGDGRCEKWKLSGIPCRHALRIITEKKLNYEDYISSWYHNSRQQQIYGDSIRPVNGMGFWNNSGSIVLPPLSLVDEIDSKRGRKPKPKRKKGRNESPTKKKVNRSRVMHCGRCGVAGHNTRKCSNIGVLMHRPKKKIPSTIGEDEHDSITLDLGEGPSQQTQD